MSVEGRAEKKIVIGVAAHKAYKMPEDKIYLPIQVGAKGKKPIGFQRDDEGKNISDKNAGFCELTGLYWVWKNVKDADYIGLAHYRRYFGKRGFSDKWARIAGRKEIEAALENTDIILPKKRHYFIETNYSHYVHSYHAQDLDVTREIIKEKYPKYLLKYDETMKRTSGHIYNMFVMKKEKADEYLDWLFDILFELEKRLDTSGYTEQEARVYGYVAEKLIDAWVETNGYSYIEMPVIFMEKINWLKKGGAFLMRKIRGGKK